MTIDTSTGVYLTTQEIKDYAEDNNLDPTEVGKKVINKLVECGARRDFSGVEFSWRRYTYLGAQPTLGGYVRPFNRVDSYGRSVKRITLEELLPELFKHGEENKTFKLKVGEVYKSGNHFVKIIAYDEYFRGYVGVPSNSQGHLDKNIYGLYTDKGISDLDNPLMSGKQLEPITTEHPNLSKIKELKEQIKQLEEEMK